jgi:hypothetical protein
MLEQYFRDINGQIDVQEFIDSLAPHFAIYFVKLPTIRRTCKFHTQRVLDPSNPLREGKPATGESFPNLRPGPSTSQTVTHMPKVQSMHRIHHKLRSCYGQNTYLLHLALVNGRRVTKHREEI